MIKVLVPTVYCRFRQKRREPSVCEQAGKKHKSSKQIADESGMPQSSKVLVAELVRVSEK
jgi:hypothetical protein